MFDETKVYQSATLVSDGNGDNVFDNKNIPITCGVPTYILINYNIKCRAYQYNSGFDMRFTLFEQEILIFWINLSEGIKTFKDSYGAFTVSGSLNDSAKRTNSGHLSDSKSGQLRINSRNNDGVSYVSTIQFQKGTTISLKAYQLNFS